MELQQKANPIFGCIDDVLRQPQKHIEQLIDYLQSEESDKKGKDICQSYMLQYTLKRCIKACCSLSPSTKQNAAYSLQQLVGKFVQKLNKDALLTCILEATDTKNAQKKNEATHYQIGRLFAIKSVIPNTAQLQKRILATILPMINQEIGTLALEVIYDLLSQNPSKKETTRLQLQHIDKPVEKSIRDCIVAQLRHQKVDWPVSFVLDVAEQIVMQYPRECLFTQHFVRSVSWPNEQWHNLWTDLIDSFGDEEKYSYKGIYFIMSILKHHLESQLSGDHIDSILYKPLLDLWMNQLVVLNKKSRQIAQEIKINVGVDNEAAFKILKFMHENSVFIGNIQKNHPLQQLYKMVDPSRYIKYLIGRLESNFIEQELCQCYAFVRLSKEPIGDKHFRRIVKMLLNQKKENQLKASKFLEMVWSLIGWRLNNQESNKDPLAKVKILLELCDKVSINKDLSEVGDYLEQLTQETQGSESKKKHKFILFAASAYIWSSLSEEEVETCSEIPLLGADIIAYIESKEATEKPRKKKKTEDPKKPIHIMVDIFIAYLTKSPNFLRTAIEGCFQAFIEDLDDSDLKSLIAVLTRPDSEYIEDNQ